MKFVIASNNKHKVEEISRVLQPLSIETIAAKQAGVQFDVEETGKTFEENALIKGLAVSKACGMPTVADDSGLEVDALGGAPGIYSARYAGVGATNANRIDKLLHELETFPQGMRTARFVCAVCCVFPDGSSVCARGECEGYIGFAPDGEGGFGYDPVFIEKTTGLSFASLSDKQKDAVSHRGKALRELVLKLREYNIVNYKKE